VKIVTIKQEENEKFSLKKTVEIEVEIAVIREKNDKLKIVYSLFDKYVELIFSPEEVEKILVPKFVFKGGSKK